MMSVYKSEEGKIIIQNQYDLILNQLSVSFESRYIETSYGNTHVLTAGDPSKPPLVLIHGSCSNAAMWIGDIEQLHQNYHIFAIDILGEPGKSDEVRLDFKSDKHSDWLHEVLTQLNLTDIQLVGNSLGGCISLHYAAKYPKQIRQLILLAASGIINAKVSFLFKSIAAVIQGEKGMLKLNRLLFATDDVPLEVTETTNMIMKHFKPITGALPVITNDQLNHLTMPVTFIAGENDCTLNVEKAVLKLNENVSKLTIDTIKDNGHVVYDHLSTIL